MPYLILSLNIDKKICGYAEAPDSASEKMIFSISQAMEYPVKCVQSDP